MKNKGETDTQKTGSRDIEFGAENRGFLTLSPKPELTRQNETEHSTEKINYFAYVFWISIVCASVALLFWGSARAFLDLHAGSISALTTVAIMVLTLFYVIYAKSKWKVMDGQLKEMREQGKIASKNAETALLTTINAERPRLFIITNEPVQNPKQTRITFNAVNRGRTPAEVIMYTGEPIFIGREKELPPVPQYAMQDQEFVHKRYVQPGESFEVYDFPCPTVMTDDMWLDMNQKRQRVVLYGHVVYRNLVTGSTHETRFCYWLSPAEWVGLIIYGPMEWNKHTSRVRRKQLDS